MPKVSRKRNDTEFEIAFYENILKDSPYFIEALVVLGDLYTKAGLWQKGLEVDITLSQLRPQDPIVFYNLACSYALLNQTRPALASLTKAIDLGYDDFNHLKKDEDLRNLLKDEHFQQFIKHITKKKAG